MRAGKDDETARGQALADLCTLYWPPVYAYIRSRGHAPHDAEDLTQGFFAKVLERNDFLRTDASRGKLRSYLLGAVKHYLSSERRDAGRLKRGGGRVLLPLRRAERRDDSRPNFRPAMGDHLA